MPTQVASLFAAIGADLTGLNQGLGQAQSTLQSAAGQMRTVGIGMSAAITTPLMGIGTAAVTMGASFEQQMGLLGIALRDTGADMDTVKGYALKMGADTVFSASEMADAMTGLAKSGQSWEEIAGDMSGTTGSLAAATSLAAASDLSLAEAADAVSIAIATFGMSTDDATRIADNFVQTADASVAEVRDLTQAFTNVGPTAAQFGWSMEDVNTALAILSERGITGAEAGTALKSMMTNLMRPTSKVTDLLDDLGVELYDASGAMRSLPNILDDLSVGMGNLSEEERNVAIQTLAGTYGMKAMASLLAEGTTGWQGMTDAVADAATAQEVADVKMGGLSGSLEQLSGSLETAALKIADVLLPVVQALIDQALLPFLDKLTSLPPPLLKIIMIVAAVAAAIGPLLLIIGALVPAIGAIGTVIGAILSPVGLAVAALVALYGAAAALFALIWGPLIKRAFESFLAGFREFAFMVGPSFRLALDRIREALEPLKAAIDALGQALGFEEGVFLKWLGGQTAIALVGAIQYVTTQLVNVIVSLTWWVEKAAAAISLFKGVIDQLRGTALPTWLTPGSPTPLQLALEGITEALGVLSGALGTFIGVWQNIWTVAVSIFRTFISFVSTAFADIIRRVEVFGEDFSGRFVEMGNHLVGSILPNMLNAMVRVLTSKISEMTSAGRSLLEGFKSGIMSKLRETLSAVRSMVSQIIDAARRGFRTASDSKVFKEIGRYVSSGLASGISEMANMPVRAVNDMVGAMTGAAMPTAPTLPAVAGGGIGGGMTVIINVNEPITVRDPSDIDRIADAITKRLRLRTGLQVYRPVASQ